MGIQYNTISDVPIASFETSWEKQSANQPLASVVANITPTQDLHGYEYPWPAGGGKNLFGVNIEQGGIDSKGGNISNPLRCRSVGFLPITPDTIYTMSANNGIAIGAVHFYTDESVESHIAEYPRGANRQLTFIAPTTAVYIKVLFMKEDNTQEIVPTDITEPMLEIGDVATTFAPYANICPITGRTDVAISLSGKNFIPKYLYNGIRNGVTIKTDADGVITLNGTNTQEAFGLTQGVFLLPGTYILSGAYGNPDFYSNTSISYSNRFFIRIDGKNYYDSTNQGIFSIDRPGIYDVTVVIAISSLSGVVFNNSKVMPMIRLATEKDSTFVPYNSSIHQISWQTEAGEVYSGTVDIVTGMLSVTGIGKVFDGTELWSNPGAGPANVLFRYIDLRSPCPDGGNRASSHFKNANVILSTTEIGYTAYTSFEQTSTFVQFRPGLGITELDDWKAWLTAQYAAGTPLECWWTISEPIVYQLSNHQIKTLLGTNNVWADSGDIKKLVWQYTIFDLLQVFINGFEITDFIAFGGWQRERSDVDGPEAGRTLDAKMHRARVATKMRYNVTCRPLRAGELASLERLIMPEYVTVKVVGDPYYGTWEKICYVNNTSSQFLILKKNGEQWWGGITFPIIEV